MDDDFERLEITLKGKMTEEEYNQLYEWYKETNKPYLTLTLANTTGRISELVTLSLWLNELTMKKRWIVKES